MNKRNLVSQHFSGTVPEFIRRTSTPERSWGIALLVVLFAAAAVVGAIFMWAGWGI